MRADPNNQGNLIPHGRGTMTLDDGSVIEGVWKNG